VTYLVSIRAFEHDQRFFCDDDSNVLTRDLTQLFPVLKILESHLWSYRTNEGYSLLIAMPVYDRHDLKQEKANF